MRVFAALLLFVAGAARAGDAHYSSDPDVAPSPPAPLTPPSPQGYKNVLFIVVDDLRPEISAYGHHYMKTPHLDKLASEGTVYTRAYVQYSFCGPSRNSFMCASCY